ncbi:MAG: alpha-L-rhamnosidase C-terminal domain-containing protein [Bacteroidales bacterium]|nr:alpha-L-rhamnosidase C-terminal domain-containing protein [Bacteroidales bacterium]
MNKKFYLFSIVCIGSQMIYSQSKLPKADKLRTDLIEYSDKVFSNGHITNLTLEDINSAIEPLQIAEIKSMNPIFSWIIPNYSNNVFQSKYRIVVAENKNDLESYISINNQDKADKKGIVWDSHEIESANNVSVKYAGDKLKPSQVYYWTVKYCDNNNNESDWSNSKSFLTAKDLQNNYSSPTYSLVKTNQTYTNEIDNGGSIFYDFGKDAYSQLTLTVTSYNDKDTLLIHLGERKQGNHVNRKPAGSTRYQQYVLPLIEGTHTYYVKIRPDSRNTGNAAIKIPSYIGEVVPFRYVEIENKNGKAKVDDLKRDIISYPFNDNAAYFECSDSVINKIWDISSYSMKATSSLGIFIDGDRERIPYEADALINQLSYYYTDNEFTLARNTHEYLINYPTWPTEWILQSVVIAWNDYLYSGDNRSLDKYYSNLKNRTLFELKDSLGFITADKKLQTPEFLESIKFKGGNIRDIVDWPSVGKGVNEDKGGETDGYIFGKYNCVVNAWHYAAIDRLLSIAKILNKENDVNILEKEKKNFRNNFNKYYFNSKQGNYRDNLDADHSSLHSNMFAALFELPKENDLNKIKDYMSTRGMACSVYGSQFLMEALFDQNMDDYALSLLKAEDDRGWKNMIDKGATITMEAWDDKYKPNQDWNHAWGAAPANIIPRKVMGIEPLEPGFKKIRIIPHLGDISHAKCKVPTIMGDIIFNVSDNNSNKFIADLELPSNTSTVFYIPCKSNNDKIYINGEKVKAKKDSSKRYYIVFLNSGKYSISNNE